ncbi:MAG: DUF1993 domain-containing protein [Burkholderiales bacterium]|nr:MAG: DUF1993 domain-containing protein [Burkholderiales bacterium]
MSSSSHAASIPVFKQMLGGLSGVLQKAESHAADRKIDPDALLLARLYPDMFPLLRQVQVATDFAKSVSARLAGVEVPKFDDTERTFADLQARIEKVLAFIDGLDDAAFTDAATREIVTQAGTPKEKRFTGQSYLLNYGLPHFFFHTTTAYDILRHNGVEIGKKDYVGQY